MARKISEKIFIYPTDTVWGIGALFSDDFSNLKIKEIKKNHSDKPMSLLLDDFDTLLSISLNQKKKQLEFFKKIFLLKITILFPKDFFNIHFSKVILGNSDFVAIRIMKFKSYFNLQMINPIITTTSLNISGNPPIINLEEAIHFNMKYCHDKAQIIKIPIEPTGLSSTIIKFNDNNLNIIRKGQDFEKIKPILRLFPA